MCLRERSAMRRGLSFIPDGPDGELAPAARARVAREALVAAELAREDLRGRGERRGRKGDGAQLHRRGPESASWHLRRAAVVEAAAAVGLAQLAQRWRSATSGSWSARPRGRSSPGTR